MTIDPLGSGDSSAIHRTFDSDVESAEVACRWLLRRFSSLLVVGHSMGGATALQVRNRMSDIDCRVWCLAPLCRMADLARSFLSVQQVSELRVSGRTSRHGLELRREMIEGAERAWGRYAALADGVWLAAADPYARDIDYSMLAPEHVRVIDGADHNFSAYNSVSLLIRSTQDALEGTDEWG